MLKVDTAKFITKEEDDLNYAFMSKLLKENGRDWFVENARTSIYLWENYLDGYREAAKKKERRRHKKRFAGLLGKIFG